METFEIKFEGMKGQLSQLCDGWRNEVELTLIRLLPEDLQPSNFNNGEFIMTSGIGEGAKSLDYLSLDMKRLLRADIIFTKEDEWVYYPSDFQDNRKMKDAVGVYYDHKAARVAQALLRTLGRPNASHLEITSLGGLFVCGRCCFKATFSSWRAIVCHSRFQCK